MHMYDIEIAQVDNHNSNIISGRSSNNPK